MLFLLHAGAAKWRECLVQWHGLPLSTPAKNFEKKIAGQGALLDSLKSFESGPHATVCPILRRNRTKGTIGGRRDHTFARRENFVFWTKSFVRFGKAARWR